MIVFDGYHVSVENGPASKEQLTAARQLVTEARRVSDARGLLAYRDYQELSDGTQIYVLRHGDIARARIVCVPKKGEVEPSYLASLPDFASGLATAGHIEAGEDGSYVPGFHPTSGTQWRLGIGAGPQNMKRFAVQPDPLRDDLQNPSQSPNAKPWSHFNALKPSMYSGKMKKVVQFLLGVGRPSINGAFDVPYSNAIKAYQENNSSELSNAELYEWAMHIVPVYNLGMQVRYDNRFYRTHGIAKAYNGRLWLVQISPSGVIGMPLPMWPYTDSIQFRDEINRMTPYDDEMGMVLDEFGGVPSGQTFPGTANGELEAWIRAGKIVRMKTAAEMAAPYAMQPFSTGMGWAFNESGTEAHNVMYEYGIDDFLYTEHWHLQFSIGGETAKQQGTDQWQARLESLVSSASAPSVGYKLAVLSKLPWVDGTALSSFIELGNREGPQAAFNALDQHVVVRYSAAAGLGRSSHEVAWHPGRYLKAPAPMKFYEPMLYGIINVQLNKLGFQWDHSKGRPPEIIDALMHVYFIGDELNYVRYYWEWNVGWETVTTNDYEECMWSGSWSSDTYTGTNAPSARFYHTQIDPRKKNAEHESHTRIKSRYLTVTPPVVGDDPTWPARGWATRLHYFERETWTDSWQGGMNRSAVIVPAFVREGVLFGEADEYTAKMHYYYKDYPGMVDPWWYELARWFGTWKFGPNGLMGGGGWVPMYQQCGYHYDRRVVVTFYSPDNCSDIVDTGSWAEECQTIDNTSYPNYPPAGSVTSTPTDQHFRVYADYPTLGGMELMYHHVFVPTQQNPYVPWGGNWFYPSPDEYGNIQNAFGLYNCLGDSDLTYGSTGPDSYGPGIWRGEPSEPKRDVWDFVGVVDASA